MKLYFLVLFLASSMALWAQNREHAFEINAQLGRGINYGNMFEAPGETDWGNPWQPEYAGMIADLGFNHVRIPIRWEPEDRSSATAPYTIESTFLQRIQQVVDSALNNGLMAIINMHHHEALYDDPEGQKARFLAQWEQISEYFKSYPDSLLFEILNEPHGNLTAALWNTFAAEALSVIREDNPTRVVLIGTAEYGGLGGLSKLQVPDDQNIILTVHYYNPFQFTHQGAEWAEGADAWLGTEWNDTETERQIVQQEFAPLQTFADTYNIPVHIGEFGAYSKADQTSREKWTNYIARYTESLGWSWAYWEFSAGFGIYNPSTASYYDYLADALLHDTLSAPAYYTGTAIYASDFAKGADEWILSTNGSAAASKENSNQQLQVSIENTGSEDWHIQLMTMNLELEAGKTYRLRFSASTAAARNITAYVGQSSSPWGAYSSYYTVALADTLTEFALVFDMSSDDDAARIVFDLGSSSETVYFESVVLEEVELQTPTSSAVINTSNSSVYPNPADEQLIVDNQDEFETISIRSINGKLLLQETLSPSTNTIYTGQLASGIYFVSLQNQNNRFTQRIVKK